MNELAILGGGSWGTALAVILAPRFDRIRHWVYEADLAQRMERTRENDVFLPGIRLPDNVHVTCAAAEALPCALVLSAIPSDYVRPVLTGMRPHLGQDAAFITATKGFEPHTLQRISEVIAEVSGSARVAVLSGPTFAREIAAGEPAAVAISCRDRAFAQRMQQAFSGPTFRLYVNDDPTGVEVGAALKNVIAIAAGICQGLGYGSNTKAALITRGLAEITRLAVAMGGQPRTLAGLAGLGDLVLTCTGDLSRNRKVGKELASGRSLGDIVGSTRMVAEGVHTTAAALALARKFGVNLPITEQVDAILEGRKSPREALRELMERSLKEE